MCKKVLIEQDVSELDVSHVTKFHELSPEVIPRQDKMNLGTLGHVAHGKSTVVKAINGVQAYGEESILAIMFKKGMTEQAVSELDVSHVTKFHPPPPEVIPPQATINLGMIGHVSHGKSTVVKAISGVQNVRFKNEWERNITDGSGKEDIPMCDVLGFENSKMNTDVSRSALKFLPDELKFEIFARSRARCLFEWSKENNFVYSLLSNESFMKEQLQFSNSRSLLMFKNGNAIQVGDGDQDPIIFHFLNESESFRMVGSSNGLVCMVFLGRDTSSVFVCNPITKKFKWLPDCNFWCSYGFGHDPRNDDYKVVKFGDNGEKEVQIFSLNCGFWRTSNWPHGKVVDDPGVYVGTSLHWIVCSDDKNWDVVAQDLSSETCQTIGLKPCLKEKEIGSFRLGHSGGKLCFYNIHEESIEVWVMEEYGLMKSWNLRAFLSNFFSMMDLHNIKLGEDIFFVSEEGCSVAKGTIISRRADGDEEFPQLDYYSHVEATPYIESLVSP